MEELLELLVLARPAGGLPAGTVVNVRRSPTQWGARESIREWVRQGNSPETFPGVYKVVKTDALTYREAVRLLEPELGTTDIPDPNNPEQFNTVPVVIRSRKAFIYTATMPSRLKDRVDIDNGEIAVTVADKLALVSSVRSISRPEEIIDITIDAAVPTLKR